MRQITMPRIRTRRERPISRCIFFLTVSLLSILYLQSNNKRGNCDSGQRWISLWSSSSFLLDILMVDGFLSSSINVNSHYYDNIRNRRCSTSKMATTAIKKRCMKRKESTIRNGNGVEVMLLVDTDTNNDSADEQQVLEILWSYVYNLQRARKMKGEIKAAYSLAHYLHSNRLDNKMIDHILLKVKFTDGNDDVNYCEDENRRSHIPDSDETKQLIFSLTEVLERALVPAIRQAGESNDYRIILRLISGGIAFANEHPILTPRIFGEALNALSQTKANAGKLKSVWNTMMGNPKNASSQSTHIDEVDSTAIPLFLASPPTAFELNTFLKSIAALGKSKACIDIYRTHSTRHSENSAFFLSNIYIQPDAYTISILFSILSDSISRDQKMCDPVNFSAIRTEAMSKIRRSIEQQRSARSTPESIRSKIESLTYSTCWQWNTAVELLDTLPVDEDKIQWRNNYVYSSLLKLQDRAQDLCNGKINSSGYHKNGPQLTMSILDDMIRHEVIPDAVTCTLAIKAMGRAAVSSNSISPATSISIINTTVTYDKNDNNLAVNFLERMKSNPKLPKPNQYSYSAAIKACARLKDHSTALYLLEEMRTDHCTITAASNTEYGIRGDKVRDNDGIIPPPNTWVYNAALLSLNNKEKSNHKQTTKRWRNKQMRKLWNLKNKEMNQQERTDVALRLLDQMNNDDQHYNLDTKPDTVTYNTIFGIGTFPHQFKTNGTRTVNMTGILVSTTISALSLIDQMKEEGIARDVVTYRNAIDASVYGNDIMDILRVCLGDYSSINRNSHKTDENAIATVFNTGLFTLTARQDFAKFKNVLTLMFEHEIPIDDETLIALIYAVGKKGKGSSLVDLIQLMEITESQYSSTNSSMHQELLESVGLIGNSSAICKLPMLSDFHYTQAINICLKENEFANAYAILSKMRAKGINPTTSCMEGFALAYAQSAMDAAVQEKKQKKSNEGKHVSVSLSRASSAYKIAMALSLPRSSTLGRVARSCAMTGEWKLCRALLRSIHNNVSTPKEDGSFVIIGPRLLQTIRGTHSYILRECAKQGSVHAALHYTNDIQEFSKEIRAKNELDSQVLIEKPRFAEIPTDEDDIFKNLRSIRDIPSSKINVGMQPNDWISVIQAASKSGHWRVCFNTLQFLRPYVQRTKLVYGDNINIHSSGERYNQLSYALYAVMRSLESHSQYAWAVRAIEDWIEWSGRQPRIESVLSAIRVLSTNERVEEIRKLIATCLQKDLSSSTTKNKNMSYEEMLYVGAVTALHNNGLYDDADEFFMSGIHDGFLPFHFVRENGQFVLDLHGLNVALAHSVVRIAMRQQVATLAEEETSQINMIIITGKGRNSEFHLQPILRPEVQRMLLEEFYPPLNTMSVPGNIGALTILAQDIEAWQEQQQQQKGIRMLKLAVVLRNLSSQERLKKIIFLKLESEKNGSG